MEKKIHSDSFSSECINKQNFRNSHKAKGERQNTKIIHDFRMIFAANLLAPSLTDLIRLISSLFFLGGKKNHHHHH